MRGLDPRIHDERPRKQPYRRNCGGASWIAGSSPAMTAGGCRLANPADQPPHFTLMTITRASGGRPPLMTL